MHVTLFKPGLISVPPLLYGGGQRAVYWLCKGLLELGHQVTLIANSESNVPGVELRVVPKDDFDPKHWTTLIPESADIVQICGQSRWLPKKPILVRHGGNTAPEPGFHPNTVFLSQRHAANFASRHFVHNGLDPSEYSCSEKREDYAVFLAKSRWDVKNLEGAAAVARMAGVELHVLGSRNLPLNAQRWLPAIQGVRYHGMIGGERKRNLLAKSRCLIFPVRWHEPFGIALIEAMASGNFVVGTPYGSLPEIVTPNTGALSTCADELAEVVRNPQRFQPVQCRDRVLKGGFTHVDMARKYVAYYEQILAHGSLGEIPPVAPASTGYNPKRLLPWENRCSPKREVSGNLVGNLTGRLVKAVLRFR